MIDDPMDAKHVCYPCSCCENKDSCKKGCAPWGEWFEAKWQEVTAVFRKKGEKES